jgi:DNA-binding transcriptional regulator GbsR (MarR family)
MVNGAIEQVKAPVLKTRRKFLRAFYRKIEKAKCAIARKKQEAKDMVKLNKTDEKVVAALKAEHKELTLQELADKTGETPKKIFRSLRKLFENEIVETQARKYKLTGKMPSGIGDEEETGGLPE